MKVIPLHRHRAKNTIAVLEALAEKARDGKIVGLALCFRSSDGFEDSIFTGDYAANPDAAAAATLRLSMKLATIRGEYDLSP